MPSDDDRSLIDEDDSDRGGFTILKNRVLKRTDISPGAKLCYAMLKMYCWQKDECFPGQETLAVDIGCSVKSVQRYLQELEAVEMVVVKRRGLGRTNVYILPKII